MKQELFIIGTDLYIDILLDILTDQLNRANVSVHIKESDILTSNCRNNNLIKFVRTIKIIRSSVFTNTSSS